MPLFFQNYSLAELKHLWIGLNKTKSFLGNKKKNDRNNKNEQ